MGKDSVGREGHERRLWEGRVGGTSGMYTSANYSESPVIVDLRVRNAYDEEVRLTETDTLEVPFINSNQS